MSRIVLFLLGLSSFAWAETSMKTAGPLKITGLNVHYHARKQVSFNIKIQPAVYWGSLGLEMEFTIGHNISFGLNNIGRLGSLDLSPISNRLQTQDYQQNGLLSEIFFRYYLNGKDHKSHFAPAGFYIHANVGTNYIVNSDGTLRPFSIVTFTDKKVGDQNQTPQVFSRPQPYFGGLGFGYQVIIYPQHLIANIYLGTQANFNGENKFQLSLYISPSIGWLF